MEYGQSLVATPAASPVVCLVSDAASFDSYLIHVLKSSLYYVGVCSKEAPSLSILEFLNTVVDIFMDYFGTPAITESMLKDHFDIVCELLEELLDYGVPYVTEPSILKGMVPPPSLITSIVNAVSLSGSSKVPTGAVSSVPWRNAGIKYTTNEIFFDINEELDVILDGRGSIITADIRGEIKCNCKLSGMPDVIFNFSNRHILQSALVSFHPCVRIFRWEKDHVLSFVPPDGAFRLMEYSLPLCGGGEVVGESITSLSSSISPAVSSLSAYSSSSASTFGGGANNLPVVVRPRISIGKYEGKVEILVQSKLSAVTSPGRQIELMAIVFKVPDYVASVKMVASFGQVHFDQSSKQVRWNVGKLTPDLGQQVFLTGNLYFETTPSNTALSPVEETVSLPRRTLPTTIFFVDFKINSYTFSGLRVEGTQVHNEAYKPYKGIRMFSKVRKFQIRI